MKHSENGPLSSGPGAIIAMTVVGVILAVILGIYLKNSGPAPVSADVEGAYTMWKGHTPPAPTPLPPTVSEGRST